MSLPELSPRLQTIEPMDVLVGLGRGEDDGTRATLLAAIAEHAAGRRCNRQITYDLDSSVYLGPLIVTCGDEPWDRAEHPAEDSAAEGMSMRRQLEAVLASDPGRYPNVHPHRIETVGGRSTIASMVLLATLLDKQRTPPASITFLTDRLHNRYGRVGASAAAVFGHIPLLRVVTYPSPHSLREKALELGMSVLTWRYLRGVEHGNPAHALAAQQRVETHPLSRFVSRARRAAARPN